MHGNDDDNVVKVNFRRPKIDVPKLMEQLNQGVKDIPPAMRPNYTAIPGEEFEAALAEMVKLKEQIELEASLTPEPGTLYTANESSGIACEVSETFKVYIGPNEPKVTIVKARYLNGVAKDVSLHYTLQSFLSSHTLHNYETSS